MVKRHSRKCSTALAIREMQIEMTLRYHFIPIRMAKMKNTSDSLLCSRECEGRGILLHCWWECKTQPFCKSVWQFLRKLGINQHQYPEIPLLGIYPKDAQSYYKDICSTVFIATLIVIARTWKQPRCPPNERWIEEMWYIYTMEYYSVVKNQWHLEIFT